MAYIEVENLSYWYPESQEAAVKDINISIGKGEIIFIVGESGSGKSTLGKVFTGAIPQFYGGSISGKVSLAGMELKQMSHRERAGEITMVFQDPERQLVMNKVHREIAFGLENIGVDPDEIKRRVWEVLQFTNSTELMYREINTLSGGQKQKVAIAGAVSYMPQCIVLDEPTSQLDPSTAEEIVNLVRKINDELGITIIIIEQRIDKWFEIADRIILMEKGCISFYGKREDFYSSKGNKIFLPSYLRVASELGIHPMPMSFKAAREVIKSNEYTFVENEAVSNSGDNECINADGLKVQYEDIEAVKSTSLKIYEGEFVCIIGANGAGKSTFLKSLAGLCKYNGSLKVFGKEVKKTKIGELAKIIGYVSQNPGDYISKDTVFEELKFTLDNHNLKDYDIIDEILSKLQIGELRNKNPRDLSGGEKQRVAIASILVTKPKILLLDEPTRGLDIEMKIQLGKLLCDLNRDGMTIILVTHDVDFAAENADRFMLMFNGDIVCDGNVREVMGNGLYYTTSVHKLFKNANARVFSRKNILELSKS